MPFSSYRRGKSESNDVDIVYTHPVNTSHMGVLKTLVQRLHKSGMTFIISSVVQRPYFPLEALSPTSYVCLSSDHRNCLFESQPLPAASSFRSAGSIKAHTEDQTVDRMLTIFQLPDSAPAFPGNPSGTRRIRRRLDLLFAPRDVYWCTVIGW